MRYQGKITSWNEGRGFGFIEWNGGNGKVFVHVSSFAEKQRRPVIGDIVTYEVTKDEIGRTRAERVAFASSASRKAAATTTRTFPWNGAAAAILIIAVGVGAFLRYKPQAAFTSHAFSGGPTATVEATFRCEGKTLCSQMSSCDEATRFI